MQQYNKEDINKRFYQGKEKLDGGQYESAIQIYNEMIPIVEKFREDKDAEVTYHTALNNRGVALCQLAKQKNDKATYLKGMEDLKLAVDSHKFDGDKRTLIAYGNLKWAKKEVKEFDEGNELSAANGLIPY